MLPSNIELSQLLMYINRDFRITGSFIFGWRENDSNLAVACTPRFRTMNDRPQDPSGIRDAIKRLSDVISRSASTATTTLKRSKSRSFNSVSNLPSRDAVPPRSAFRGSRSPGISDRRVSFYDSLPCLDYGPSFNFQVPWSEESAERRGDLLMPAMSSDDRSTDDHLCDVDYNREKPVMNPKDMQPAARHDSSVEPLSLRQTRSARRSGSSGRLSGNAERRRSCMDFTKAMMQENARSRSLTRPLSLLADKAVRGQSPRPAGHVSADVPVSRRSSQRPQNQTSRTDDLGDISHAYKEHVDRSLRLMQGHDQRGSVYLHEALIEIQEALAQAMDKTTTTELPSTDEDEADHAHAHAGAAHHSSGADDKTDDAFSFDMPYDSAQPSAEAISSTKATHLEVSPRVSERSDDDSIFDPALMPLPLRIRPRHHRRDSTAAQER